MSNPKNTYRVFFKGYFDEETGEPYEGYEPRYINDVFITPDGKLLRYSYSDFNEYSSIEELDEYEAIIERCSTFKDKHGNYLHENDIVGGEIHGIRGKEIKCVKFTGNYWWIGECPIHEWDSFCEEGTEIIGTIHDKEITND